MPTRAELVAHNRTIEEIRTHIGADALFYQTIEDMHEAVRVGNPHITQLEDSCFSGVYRVGTITKQYLRALEKARAQERP